MSHHLSQSFLFPTAEGKSYSEFTVHQHIHHTLRALFILAIIAMKVCLEETTIIFRNSVITILSNFCTSFAFNVNEYDPFCFLAILAEIIRLCYANSHTIEIII